MDKEDNGAARRRLLHRSLAIATALTAVPITVWIRQAAAESSLKANFHYQERPKGADRCADCAAYVDGAGSCKILREAVSANGWCMAFTRKAP